MVVLVLVLYLVSAHVQLRQQCVVLQPVQLQRLHVQQHQLLQQQELLHHQQLQLPELLQQTQLRPQHLQPVLRRQRQLQRQQLQQLQPPLAGWLSLVREHTLPPP
jgi:hypothetical protein